MSLLSLVEKKNLHNFSKILLNFQNRYQFEFNLEKKTKGKKKNSIASIFNELKKESKKVNFLDRKKNNHKCNSFKNLLNFINYEQNKEILNMTVIETLEDNSNYTFSNQIRVLFKEIFFIIQKDCENILNENIDENFILNYLENMKKEIKKIHEKKNKDDFSDKYLLLLKEFNSSKKQLEKILPNKNFSFSKKIEIIKEGLSENNRIVEKIKKNINFMNNEENQKKIKLCLSLIKKDFESMNTFQDSNKSENSLSGENTSLTIKNVKRTFLPFGKITRKNSNLQIMKKRSSFNSNINSGFYPSENISYNSIDLEESKNEADNLTLFFTDKKKESNFKTQKMNKHYSERNILENFEKNIYSENEKNKLKSYEELNQIYENLIKKLGFEEEIINKLQNNDENIIKIIQDKIENCLNSEKKFNVLKNELELLKKTNLNQNNGNHIQSEKRLIFQANTIKALEKEIEIIKYNENSKMNQNHINLIYKNKLKDYLSKSLNKIKNNLRNIFNDDLFTEIFEIINYFKQIKEDYNDNIIKIFDENENLKNELQYVLEEEQLKNSVKQEIIDKFIDLQKRFKNYSEEKDIQFNQFNQIFTNLEFKTKKIINDNNLKKGLKDQFNKKIKKLNKQIYIKYNDIDNAILKSGKNLKDLTKKINKLLENKNSLKTSKEKNNSEIIKNKLSFVQHFIQSFEDQIENKIDEKKVYNLKLKVDVLKSEIDKKKNLLIENQELKEINAGISERLAESKKFEENLKNIIDEYKNEKKENKKNLEEKEKKIVKLLNTESNLKNVINNYAQNLENNNYKITELEKIKQENQTDLEELKKLIEELENKEKELLNTIEELKDKNENIDSEMKGDKLKSNNMTLISEEPSENFKSFRGKNSVSKLSKFSQKKNKQDPNNFYRNFSDKKNIVYNNSDGALENNNFKFKNEKIRESIHYFSNKLPENKQNEKLEKIITKVNNILVIPTHYMDLENDSIGRLFNIIESLKLFILNSKRIFQKNYDSQKKSLKTPSKLSASMNKDKSSKRKKSKTNKQQINKRLEKLTKNYGNISLSKKRFMKIQEDKKKSKNERKIFSMMEKKDDKSNKYRSEKSKSKNYNSVLDLVPEHENILENNKTVFSNQVDDVEIKELEKKLNVLKIKNDNLKDERKKNLKIIINNEKLMESLKKENNSLKKNLDPLINQSNVYIELFQKIRDNCINILQENRDNIDNSFESIPKLINSIQSKFENFENVIFSMEEEIEKKNMEIEWLQENLEKLNEKIQENENKEKGENKNENLQEDLEAEEENKKENLQEDLEEENLNINLNNKDMEEDFNSDEEIKDKNFQSSVLSLEQFEEGDNKNGEENLEQENLMDEENDELIENRKNQDSLIEDNNGTGNEFEEYDEDDSPQDNEEIRDAFDKFIKDIFIHSENNLDFIEKIEKMIEEDNFEEDDKLIFEDIKNNGFDIKEKIECLYKNLMEFFKDLDNNNKLSKKQLNEIAQENEFLYEKYTNVNKELERLKSNKNKNGSNNLETNDVFTGSNDILLKIIKNNINILQDNNKQDNEKILCLNNNLQDNIKILKENFNLDIKIIKSKQNSVDLGQDLILKENQIQFLEDEINLSNQKMQMYETKIQEMQNKLNKKDDRKNKEKIKKLKLFIKDLEKKLIKAEEIHTEYEQDQRDYIEKIESLEENINELVTRINGLKSELKNSKSKKNFLKGKSSNFGGDLNKKVKDLSKNNQNLRDKTMFLTEELKKTKLQMKKKLKNLENKYMQSSGHDSSKRMSLKKKTDFIKLQNELRQKNKYIDSLMKKMRQITNNKNFNINDISILKGSINDSQYENKRSFDRIK